MPLEIRLVETKKDLETFLHVPWTLGMKSDPNWVPPLLDDYRRSLDPKKSPFLKHGEIQCFLALDDKRPVGRISAQIDTDFDKQWPQEKGVAFFGFFDSADDPAVARALFDEASGLGPIESAHPDPRARSLSIPKARWASSSTASIPRHASACRTTGPTSVR